MAPSATHVHGFVATFSLAPRPSTRAAFEHQAPALRLAPTQEAERPSRSAGVLTRGVACTALGPGDGQLTTAIIQQQTPHDSLLKSATGSAWDFLDSVWVALLH
jgi:hypothetical protein